MEMLRRRLASCALAVTLLQVALMFAAPLSACCRLDDARSAASRAMAAADCCPPGSHPPGQCPRHESSRTAARSDCRMTCAASPSGVLIATIGVLSVPAAVHFQISSSPIDTARAPMVAIRPALPDAPPPKHL